MNRAAFKKQPRKPTQVEFEIEPHLMSGLLVRCRECGQFGLQAAMSVAGCTICDWHTARCQKCGGEDTAKRGVHSHHAYFATRGVKDFGAAHAGSWSDYHSAKERRQKIRLLPPHRPRG